MVLYILAIPVFSLALPLYSFWHMDDFSWGNTRVVTGEKGRKIVITDEGKFDPSSIPKKKWEEYQAELWDAQTFKDDRSEVSGYSYATKSYHPPPQSEFGAIPPSRPMSSMGAFASQAPYGQSRASIAATDVRPFSTFGQEVEMMNLSALPSDDAILAEIREILATSDLMSVSKKSVKMELERRFGVLLEGKRAYINSGMLRLLDDMREENSD
jgi:chitin synthase